jgi:hypothetical protein
MLTRGSQFPWERGRRRIHCSARLSQVLGAAIAIDIERRRATDDCGKEIAPAKLCVPCAADGVEGNELEDGLEEVDKIHRRCRGRLGFVSVRGARGFGQVVRVNLRTP